MHPAGRPSTMGAMTDHEVTAGDVDELMAIGRDREAVEAATRSADQDVDTAGAEQLAELMPHLRAVVARIDPAKLAAPTPCERFDVRGVLEHMIAGTAHFAPAFRGEPGPAAAPANEEDVLERWGAAMTDLLDAVHSPGAGARTIASPMGEVPGAAFARFVVFDGLMHGWDLATATGQPYAPPAELVDEVGAFARQALAPEMRDGDTFAAETEAPADAGSLERLVAFSGRRLPTGRTAR
jgi:uncharacterized protein (TIGR03086 family)